MAKKKEDLEEVKVEDLKEKAKKESEKQPKEKVENEKQVKTNKIEKVGKVNTSEPTQEEKKLKEEKVNSILKKAKEKGKITYGDLATELDDVNPEQIDKVFDAFEELGVDLLSDDMDEEPDIEDLKEDFKQAIESNR